jgi:predicted transcriptional regulator
LAEVECEDLTAAEFAVLAAIVEIHESGQLSFLDTLCRKTRLPETVVKNAVRHLVNIGFVEIPRQ